MKTEWNDLGVKLSEPILQTLKDLNFIKTTPVQVYFNLLFDLRFWRNKRFVLFFFRLHVYLYCYRRKMCVLKQLQVQEKRWHSSFPS